MTELKDNVLNRIKNGQIAMKPKWHFVLRSLFYTSGLLVMFLVSIYFLSFVLYVLRDTGLWWIPGFGLGGLQFFIMQSPWLLIAVTFVFLASAFLLVRHFGHNYRHRNAYTLIGVVLIIIAGASVIDYLAVHDRVKQMTDHRHIPGLSPFYGHKDNHQPRDITPGMITAISEQTIILTNPDGVYTVTITNARRPRGFEPALGDHVLVFGPFSGTSSISAKGIRPLPPPMEGRLEKRSHQ